MSDYSYSRRRQFLMLLTALLAVTGQSLTASAQTQTAAKPGTPLLEKPILFNTVEADKIVAKLQIFPADNPWNSDISRNPVHPDSRKMVASIGAAKNLAYNLDMGFVLVPKDQPLVPVEITTYREESDPGPYPVPDNATIEGWPLSGGTLDHIQRVGDGDRHMIVVQPETGKLFEFYEGRRLATGWTATQASIFDLGSNRLRPETWCSSDAAGLPIFPSIVRYDELERGKVTHALRFTVRNSRRAYVYPATHFASSKTDPSLPRMGERFRLRADFDTSGFSPHPKAILEALKTYGMFVADNGGDWRISVAPDERIKDLDELRKVKGKDFQVVQAAANKRVTPKRGR